MRNVLCVSAPRSGHHFLVNILLCYFSGDIHHPKTSGDYSCKDALDLSLPVVAGDFGYCEFYRHCRKIPCTDPKTNLQKNHDFDLQLPIDPKRFYIVQFRDFASLVIPFYRLCLQNKWDAKDSAESWRDFARRKFEYWKGFIKKWCSKQENQFLLLRFDELINNPEQQIKRVIQFMQPKCVTDNDFLAKIISACEIAPPPNPKQFKYYDEYSFKKMEKESREILASVFRG